MLRDLPILDTGALRSQSKILIEMAEIGGGAPKKIYMVNCMVCKRTMQTIKTMNGQNKTRRREKPTKIKGHIVQGIMGIRMETEEADKQSLCHQIFSLHCELTI